MRVWITKYALTQGIFEADGKICTDIDENMIDAGKAGLYHNHYSGIDEWHKTKESAIRAAEHMRQKKIASLEKQIARLKKLKFE